MGPATDTDVTLPIVIVQTHTPPAWADLQAYLGVESSRAQHLR